MAKIRFYKDSDYEEVIIVLKEGNLFDTVWESRENLKRKIGRDSESILVAEEDGKIVACVFLVEDGWSAFIWRLSVRKNYRKKGIGSQLMEEVEKIAKKRKNKEISLFVDENNIPLEEWYKKQKYIQTKDYTFMYKKL